MNDILVGRGLTKVTIQKITPITAVKTTCRVRPHKLDDQLGGPLETISSHVVFQGTYF